MSGFETFHRICVQAGVPEQKRGQVLGCILDRSPFDPLHLVRMTKAGDLDGINGLNVSDATFAIDDEEALFKVPVRAKRGYQRAGYLVIDVVSNDVEALVRYDDVDPPLGPAWGTRSIVTAERLALRLNRVAIGPKRLKTLRDIFEAIARTVRGAHHNQAVYAKEPSVITAR